MPGYLTDQYKQAARTWLQVSLLVLATSASTHARALEFYCEAPGDNRYIRVDIPGEQNLCEVAVSYDASGERKAMWYADIDTLFCSAKAYSLRDKYESQWNFNCNLWPDTDGIHNLSLSQRSILDSQLKAMIDEGRNATPPFTVNAVRASASTPINRERGILAVQYFLSSGDSTQIIHDNVDNWSVFVTVDNLAAHIDSQLPVSNALLQSVTSSGALTINTSLLNDANQHCYGTQVLTPTPGADPVATTAHRYVCYPASLDSIGSTERTELLVDNDTNQ